jgi:aminoglycoside/choline kinase family phosphotransferase
MKDRAAKIDVFLDAAGWGNAARTIVAGDASNRRYDRLTTADSQTAILMDAPPDRGEDVRPFIAIADHLRQCGLSAPRIYASDPSSGLLILEDLGNALFADLMTADQAQEIPLYRAATDVLIHLHRAPKPQLPICDAKWLAEMIAPVFEWYVPKALNRDIARFQAVFEPLLNSVVDAPKVMILRDYHAQNLLFLPDRNGIKRVGILDFQDALLGHPAYDLVSILQDARRDVSANVEAEIMAYMLQQTEYDGPTFRAGYAVQGLQRNLRILGIFARLCLRDGKAHYVDFIPRVWGYIERNLAHPDLAAVAAHLRELLPVPTPAFLEDLKRQCPPQTAPP